MAFTYDSDALDVPLNHLRLLTQDTQDAGHFFEDAEIIFVASSHLNAYRAAAHLCRVVAARLAKTPSQKDSTITFDAEARVREMRLLAEEYEKEAVRGEMVIKAAQELELLNGSVIQTISLTPDNPRPPAFTRGLHYS